jgi:hypothetical protein
MIRRSLKFWPIAAFFVVLVAAWFTATSLALAAVAGDPAPAADPSFWDLLKPIYTAFQSHQYGLMVPLVVILVVAAARRWLGDKWAFLHTDTGGSLLVLLGAAATASVPALTIPDAHWTLSLLKSSLEVGFMAAGGYAALKNLIVEPLLKPLEAKYPAWSPLFDLVLWVFDHVQSPAQDATKKAESAGDAAVKAAPAQGTAAVLGAPVELA